MRLVAGTTSGLCHHFNLSKKGTRLSRGYYGLKKKHGVMKRIGTTEGDTGSPEDRLPFLPRGIATG